MGDFFSNLVYAFLGSLIYPLIFSFIPKVFKYILNLDKRAICKLKYGYCWSIEKGSVSSCQEYKIKIKKAFISDYSITATCAAENNRTYKGKCYIRNAFLECDHKSEGLEIIDFSYHKYDIQNLERDNYCLGFWLSSDKLSRVSCGGIILSVNAMGESEITKCVKKYKKNRSNPVMYIG